MRLNTLAFLAILLSAHCLLAQDAEPSALQKKLIGHWIAEKDPKLNFYFSPRRRLVDRDIPNSDAQFSMTDYQVYDEWPDLRTIVLTVSISEGTQVPAQLVITFSEAGQSAVCREKSGNAWSKSFRLVRIDERTYPAKMPEKLKILDLDSGVGPTP